MFVNMELVNIKGRALALGGLHRRVPGLWTATVDQLNREWEFDAVRVAAEPDVFAVDAATWFLDRFGCTFSRELLESLRAEVERGDWT